MCFPLLAALEARGQLDPGLALELFLKPGAVGTNMRKVYTHIHTEEIGGCADYNLHWFAHAHVDLETMYAAPDIYKYIYL